MSKVLEFQENHPSRESYWRSVVLFGKNTATYKFALAKSLLKFVRKERNIVTLAELAEPYSQYLCEHLRDAPRQTKNNSSTFLDACKRFNLGDAPKEKLLEVTEREGFKYVLDAFHKVNGKDVPLFYKKEKSRIVITDYALELNNLRFFENLVHETESRWNLVEKAWELGLTAGVLYVDDEVDDGKLIVKRLQRRILLTSARDALNGYQKGKCFYCFSDLDLTPNSRMCDVDHFFPHCLFDVFPNGNWNGVWNLVLACQTCNRGEKGKFARVPDVKYLERLHKRNEFLINSHHPLQETLMQQTGKHECNRTEFLYESDRNAISVLIHRWQTPPQGEEVF